VGAPPGVVAVTERRALLAAAVTGILVGAAIVASRGVVDQVGPASLALLRYAIGCLCLLPAVALARRTRIRPGDLLPIGLLGIGQFGILIVLLNVGLRTVPAARAAVIFATLPLLTLVLAAGLGQERLSVLKILSVLLSLLSVAITLGGAALFSAAAIDWSGVFAVFGSAACGAVCSVFYRPYLRRYPALPVSAMAMVAAVAFLALLAVPEGLFDALPRLQFAGWAAVVFIGLSSGVGYFLWLWALGQISATRVTVFLALSPITASLLGAAWLGESLSVWSAVGVLGVALSLWLARPD
jgi:drug/metabolite transporter (DMT)-like permease